MTIPINYKYDKTKLGDYYYTSLAEIKETSNVVTTASDNPIQYKNLSNFLLGFGGALNYFDLNGVTHMEGYFDAYKIGITAKDIFNGSGLSEGMWKTLLKNAGVKA